MLGAMLLSTINLAYYQELMAGMRDGHRRPGALPDFRARHQGSRWAAGAIIADRL